MELRPYAYYRQQLDSLATFLPDEIGKKEDALLVLAFMQTELLLNIRELAVHDVLQSGRASVRQNGIIVGG